MSHDALVLGALGPDEGTLDALLRAGVLSPDRVLLAAYLGHPEAGALVGVSDADRIDPLDDDALFGLEGSGEAPVRVLAALAHRVVEPSDDARIVAGLAAVDRWLAGEPPFDLVSLSRHRDAILGGGFGDLGCVPECCWRRDSVKAYLVAAALERLVVHAGGAGGALYGSQNLREMFETFRGFDVEWLAEEARASVVAWALAQGSPPGGPGR